MLDYLQETLYFLGLHNGNSIQTSSTDRFRNRSLDDLAEFADNMELCDGPFADLPVVIEQQPTSRVPSDPA